MRNLVFTVVFLCLSMGGALFAQDVQMLRVQTENGLLEGVEMGGIRAFKGIPYAKPPVGELRWQVPLPAEDWDGIRKADAFGPRAMQRRLFDDMIFRSDGMSEDCLYLNVWTPANRPSEMLPVLVYFYGGGLFTGDGSEPRYDGESMAREGIVSVTVNYRLNIFGFFAHPTLSNESSEGVSGNYGFYDQRAALQWIQRNIAAFGGDPDRVTIAGESAGSVSVSAQMASPLSKGLIAGAIGSSGSLMGTLRAESLESGEKKGKDFSEQVGASSLEALRALSAEQLLEATAALSPVHFSPVIDGHFFPKPAHEIFEAGEQADVPLLLGWNSEEMGFRAVMSTEEPTYENFISRVRVLYEEAAETVIEAYAPDESIDVVQAATDLAGDRFTGFSTWKWGEMHARTGSQPVFRYYYARPRPPWKSEDGSATRANGAVHSAEIEYAMGNLATNWVYEWEPEDFYVSRIFQRYYANFVKNGDPNGSGVPVWPSIKGAETPAVMHIDVHTRVEPSGVERRYHLIDGLFRKQEW